MKKLLVLCLALVFLFSCSIDDGDQIDFTSDILPVERVDIPDQFELGETYPITVYYYKPSNCHSFREFYYLKENNERTIAPINYVFERNDCETENVLVEATFNFTVESNGSYIFKFWQGEDADGEIEHLIFEIPVIE